MLFRSCQRKSLKTEIRPRKGINNLCWRACQKRLVNMGVPRSRLQTKQFPWWSCFLYGVGWRSVHNKRWTLRTNVNNRRKVSWGCRSAKTSEDLREITDALGRARPCARDQDITAISSNSDSRISIGFFVSFIWQYDGSRSLLNTEISFRDIGFVQANG